MDCDVQTFSVSQPICSRDVVSAVLLGAIYKGVLYERKWGSTLNGSIRSVEFLLFGCVETHNQEIYTAPLHRWTGLAFSAP